ncbi:hypothetical protein [Bacillus solimangrovi]|uniref:hypothetical protein n=1 Tax=Bacillus solimangrovi TaxID=1305675 RepID=UPI0015867521|nr:hypothetical protein [Bacillus solimangrovi]
MRSNGKMMRSGSPVHQMNQTHFREKGERDDHPWLPNVIEESGISSNAFKQFKDLTNRC